MLLAWCLYSLSASLPFLGLTTWQKYAAGVAIAIAASIIWTTIALKVPTTSIAYWGLIYDVGLTAVFFAAPLLWTGSTITTPASVGLLLIFVGMGLLKL
jgi:hypothetical protein